VAQDEEPDLTRLDRSEGVPDHRVPAGIAREIAGEGGLVTFARFMDLALTHPTDGYYRQVDRLLGPQGHFSTAPRLSPAFGRAVARLVGDLVEASLSDDLGRGGGRVPETSADHATSPSLGISSDSGARPAVIELGGGEADLAAEMLAAWEVDRPVLRGSSSYRIVEIGEGLRERQRTRLADLAQRGWRIGWAESLAEAAVGTDPVVVVGNEFLDALPVHLIDVRGEETREAYVELEGGSRGVPRERWGRVSPEAEQELVFLFGTAGAGGLRCVASGGVIELRPSAGDLVREVTGIMPRGCLLTIDYGEYRAQGRTVRGYFRHEAVDGPYARIGRQDLTADVDFRALDLHGREAGFEVVLYATVADMLRADGGEARLLMLRERASGRSSLGGAGAETSDQTLDADREATVLEALLDREGLGGAFKLMLQVRE